MMELNTGPRRREIALALIVLILLALNLLLPVRPGLRDDAAATTAARAGAHAN